MSGPSRLEVRGLTKAVGGLVGVKASSRSGSFWAAPGWRGGSAAARVAPAARTVRRVINAMMDALS